jgi:hypothetical protein
VTGFTGLVVCHSKQKYLKSLNKNDLLFDQTQKRVSLKVSTVGNIENLTRQTRTLNKS